MLQRIKEWKEICQLHWKEIISLAIALHWVMDLLIIGPLFFLLGYFFGINGVVK